jgi:hypothetical protein
MAYTIDSPVFQPLRGRRKLSNRHLAQIVEWIDRSEIWTCLLDDFVEHDGVYQYSEDTKNYFWTVETPEGKRVPTINVSIEYKGTHADVVQLAGVMCHELAHYVSFYRCKFNPNNQETSDLAAVVAVWDEGRAHTLEFLVQEEINSQGRATVEWMKEGQREAIENSRASLIEAIGPDPDLEHIEAGLERGAHALWQWSARYVGPDPTQPCYLQYYKDCWFDVAEELERRGEYTLKEKRFDVAVSSIAAKLRDENIEGISYDGGPQPVRYAWARDLATIAAFKPASGTNVA